MTRAGAILLMLVIARSPMLGQADSSGTGDTDPLIEQLPPPEDSPPELDELPQGERGRRDGFLLRSRLQRQLTLPRGYEEGTYRGGPEKLYQRVSYGNRMMFGGLVLTKDAGEAAWNDFTSGTLSFRIPHIRCVLGSFLVEHGEGIALWRAVNIGKGADPVTPLRRSARGLVPVLSRDEINYLSGIALEAEWSGGSFGLFLSNRRLSSSIDTAGLVTSLPASGYFRTRAEITRRDNLTERLIGFRGLVRFGSAGSIGLAGYTTRFSRELRLGGPAGLSANGYAILSLDYSLNCSGVQLFGEWALSKSTVAGISSILLHPASGTDLVAALRYYPAPFVSLHASGFGNRFPNEEGFFLAARARASPVVRFSLYYDQCRSLFPPAGFHFTSVENDLFGQADVTPGGGFRFQGRLQQTASELPVASAINGLPSGITGRRIIRRARVAIRSRLPGGATVETRIERLFLRDLPSEGMENAMLVHQDVMFDLAATLRVNIRIAPYLTDSYESRLYDFENDVDGAFSLPALYGRGSRWYVLMRYQVSAGIRLSSKYSELQRDGVRHIGSGPDELPANHDRRVTFQLDMGL